MTVQPVVLIFRRNDAYGWSERYWVTPGGSLSDTISIVNSFMAARAAILSNSCYIQRARIGTGFYRNPFIYIPNGGAGFFGLETPPAAEQEVALLLQITGNPNGINRPFVKGIPSRVITGDQFTPDATFSNNLNTFTTELLSGAWNVVGSVSGGTPIFYPMTALNPTAPRGYSFSYTVPGGSPTPVLGDKINVSGANIPGYNGRKRIVAISSAGVITVGGAAPPVPNTSSAPKFELLGQFVNPIFTVQPDSITLRRSGRPFGLVRGRRQTLYSLRQ